MPGVTIDNYVGRIVGDRYQLVAPVGTGASATVYTADDQSLERRVAVKVLHEALAQDPKFAKRFRNEARAVAKLAHPRILNVYDWAEGDDCYIVTEFLAGGSLRHMLDKGHQLSVSQCVVVGLHALEGLEAAHRSGFVHRDIKPANLLFGADGRLRIGDFGIARVVAEAAWTEPEGALIGTARYAAPEQGSGSVVTGAADIYSLALTLIEAVTGSVPLVADSPIATMVLRQDTNVEVPAEMGPLWEPLSAATKADPEQRPSAGDLIRGFHRAASDLPRPYVLPLANLDSAVPAELDYPEATGTTGSTALIGDGNGDDEGIAIGDGLSITDSGPDSTEAESDEASVQLDKSADASALGSGSEADGLSGLELHFADDDLAAMGMASGEVDQVVGASGATEFDEMDRPRTIWPYALVALIVASAITAVVSAQVFQSDTAPTGPVAAVAGEPLASYLGIQEEEAVAAITEQGWVPVIERTRLRDTDPGEVLGQNPIEGNVWPAEAEVTLLVSEGPPLVAMPTLVGLSRSQAFGSLEELLLGPGSIVETFDEDAPRGQIIAAEFDVGTEVPEGEPVDLMVSAGPAPRPVPELAGLTVEAATAELGALDLVLVEGEPEPSLDIAEGSILATVPAASATTPKGSEVIVTVSSGLPFVEIPRTRGLSVAEATEKLRAAGLVIDGVDGSPDRSVLVTNPPDGDSVRIRTGVTIITRR